MTINRTFGGLIAACVLASCSTAPPSPPSADATGIDQHILAAARRIEEAQAQLNQAGAFGTVQLLAQDRVAQGQTVSISWHGDAEQLLARLAEARGVTFATLGLRMPLPIALDAKGETIDSVLTKLRAQVGYRASIEQLPGQMVLHYNPPRT